MNAFLNRAKAFLVSEDGPTATEYAVMLALIIVAAATTVSQLGTQVDAIFGSVKDELAGAQSS